MEIALFTTWGARAGIGMVPIGCPKEYARYEKRRKFAEWLKRNATEEGPFIIEEWEGGAVTYEYIFLSERISFPMLIRVALVEVDETRPWLIHSYDGWEEIWYLDKTGDERQVLPEIFKTPVDSYYYGEKKRKFNCIAAKMPEYFVEVSAVGEE